MEPGTGKPSSEWKLRMLYAEHSPIRLLKIKWKWEDLKTWISTHFVRHHVGFLPYVESQREDRNEYQNRDNRPQAAPVSQDNEANAQAVINISRKRLCRQSHAETKQAWQLMLDKMKDIEPELYKVCVPECVRCGFCPEYESCGYIKSAQGISQRERYVDLLKNVREG
ncbi:MAG: thymidylate synthase ThyX [Bacteroidales bacterium]